MSALQPLHTQPRARQSEVADTDTQPSVNDTDTYTHIMPRYAAPTTAATLPEYSNAEAEVIRQSFSTGSYRMLAHLPNELKVHRVSSVTAQRIDENLMSTAAIIQPYGSYRILGKKGHEGLFSSFDYKGEDDSLASSLLHQTHPDSSHHSSHPRPFLYSTARPVVLNALAGASSSSNGDAPQPSRPPFDSTQEFERQLAHEHQSKILHGPFLPVMKNRGIGEDVVPRSKLPDIVAQLMKEIDRDWKECQFQIYCDPEDLIICQFSSATVEDPRQLLTYMNAFMKTNHVVSTFKLTKLVELWNHHDVNDSDGAGDGGYIYYAFRPPFVRRRIDQTFTALHPEMARSASARSQNTDARSTERWSGAT